MSKFWFFLFSSFLWADSNFMDYTERSLIARKRLSSHGLVP
jgi:hypothetical protein